MGRALPIVSSVILTLAALTIGLSMLLIAAELQAWESDCEAVGDEPCTDVEWLLEWSSSGQRITRDQLEPEAETHVQTRTWATLGDAAGADDGQLGRLLTQVAVAAAAAAAVAVVVAIFTHRAVAIVAGVVAIVAALLAVAATFLVWGAANDAATAFVDALMQRADEQNRAWEKDGPVWGTALTVTLLGALLALVGGVMAMATRERSL